MTVAAGTLQQLGGPALVLASGSTARAAMLRAAGFEFHVIRPSVDEETMREALAAEGLPGPDAATALAETKAMRGAGMITDETAIVLGADQLLEFEGRWLAKPADRTQAAGQLAELAGKRHRLISAVVAYKGGARVWHTVQTASLVMRPFDCDFIERYLDAAGPEVTRSVGCYQIEGLGSHLMAQIEGDHFTIQGLPLLPLLDFLRIQGVAAGR